MVGKLASGHAVVSDKKQLNIHFSCDVVKIIGPDIFRTNSVSLVARVVSSTAILGTRAVLELTYTFCCQVAFVLDKFHESA